MQRYEYRVMPSPRKGEKAKTAKTVPDRFAVALTALMNRMGAEGWEYLRADTLPCEERVGFTGRSTTFQTMLVFRRALAAAEPAGRAEVPVPRPADPVPVAPRLGTAEGAPGSAPALGPAASVPPPAPAARPASGGAG